MAKWYKIPTYSRVTEAEYKAGFNALNIVFGAVLGFVLVGGNDLPAEDFAGLLVISAAIVMMIQYISLSEYTLFNVAMTGAAIYMLPTVAEGWFSIERVPNLQVTLAVWAVMATFQEIFPRVKAENEKSRELIGETKQ